MLEEIEIKENEDLEEENEEGAEKKLSREEQDKILNRAKDFFKRSNDYFDENRKNALDDLKFGRLGVQWPAEIQEQRKADGRPCLTINRLPSFIRQVVNDARQNKPQIKVHPVDNNADVETAKIIDGLIRNIEVTSRADIAYDTAIDSAASMGFGYIRICTDYSHTESFEQDIKIERVANPFVVHEDPNATSADGSDWNGCIVSEMMTKDDFKKKYPEAEQVDFESDGKDEYAHEWITEDSIRVAEYWERKTVKDKLLLFNDEQKTTMLESKFKKDTDLQALFSVEGIGIKKQREIERYEVKMYLITGAEVLRVDNWPGNFIPVVPVYGDEINIEGKRVFESLIRQAKDSQRNFNYWRSSATELVALAPKAPWVGPKGFANGDEGWNTANTQNHAYLEYEGQIPPTRQPFSGVPAGALQEALNASDDLKSVMGVYDASLGAKSNETSGRAIMARQKEGDVSTFHFIDNLSRAIRQVGAILIDLIPHIYTEQRIIRVIGEDGTPKNMPINQPVTVDEKGEVLNPALQAELQGIQRVFDLTIGKYDLVVSSGPSFNTRREEAAFQMTEFVRAFPQSAPVIGDLLATNLDWPGAEEVAERLRKINPVLQQEKEQAPSPEVIKAQADLQMKQLEAQMKERQSMADLEMKKMDLRMKEIDFASQQEKNRAEIAKASITNPNFINNNF